MSKPSSTAQAAGISAFIASTILLVIKIAWPEIYAQIPVDYQGHLIAAVAFFFAWRKRENVYDMTLKEKK